jgi:hypothetical protein
LAEDRGPRLQVVARHFRAFQNRRLLAFGGQRLKAGTEEKFSGSAWSLLAFTASNGWKVAAIEPDRIQTRFHDDGAPAWLATIKRI